MNRFCEDCRHWTRNPAIPLSAIYRGDDADVVMGSMPATWGDCGRVRGDAALAAPIDDAGAVVTLQTEQHFSCNQWQSK